MDLETNLNEGFIEENTEDNPPLSPTSVLKAINRRTYTEDLLENALHSFLDGPLCNKARPSVLKCMSVCLSVVTCYL